VNAIVEALVGALLATFRSKASLVVENLALRQQLAVLRRRRRRPHLRAVRCGKEQSRGDLLRGGELCLDVIGEHFHDLGGSVLLKLATYHHRLRGKAVIAKRPLAFDDLVVTPCTRCGEKCE
jgi:hypothetical protein